MQINLNPLKLAISLSITLVFGLIFAGAIVQKDYFVGIGGIAISIIWQTLIIRDVRKE